MLWVAAALAALGLVATARAATFPDFHLHRTAAVDSLRSKAVLERIASLRRERAAGRVTQDVFMMPGGSLGIMRRGAGGRWAPARPPANRRDEILRTGSLEALSHGELAKASIGTKSFAGQDTVRILVLRIDFLHDRLGTQTTGDGKFDVSNGGADPPPVDAPPHNRAFYESQFKALSRYFDAEFHHRVVVQYDVYPQADSAYHCNDMGDFGPWKISQDVFPIAYKMLQEMLAAADTQDTSIPWSKFDRVAIIHAGSDLQSDTKLDSPYDIPTFTIGLDSTLAVPVADSTFFVFGSAILPETANQDGNFAALNAVIAHEHGHNIFGWRDVYDVFSGFPVCGYWTLMDTGNLTGTTVVQGTGADQKTFFAIGLVPPLADPYQRHLAYPDIPEEVETIGVDSLKSPLVEAKAIKVPLDSEEYLLLENRQGDLNGNGTLTLVRDSTTGVILGPGPEDPNEYDYLLPGYGILAWQVDESVVAFDPPGARADAFYSLNGNPTRRGLHILEGDGLQDIGDFTSPYPLGSPLDPWFLGNGTRIAPDGRPPLLTNSHTNPHVVVDVLDSLRLSMSVRVTPDWRLPGWPIKAKAPVGGIEPLVMNFNGIGRRVVFSAGDNAIHAAEPNGTDHVLFQAPMPLSPVAELDDATRGPIAVAVYPDPAQINSQAWATNGSWIVAVDGSGNVLPGFPLQTSAGEWITAGPMVMPPNLLTAVPRIVVGTRTGSLASIGADGSLTEQSSSGFQAVAGSFASPSAILALATLKANSCGAIIALADSSGNVGFTGGCLAPPQSGSGPGWPAGWLPTLAWANLNVGPNGFQSDAEGRILSTQSDLVVLDRRTGNGAFYQPYLVEGSGVTGGKLGDLHGLNAPLTKGMAVGDIDGDGFNEIVIATQDGRVGFWNLSGSATPGWPKGVDPEAFASEASPVVANLDASPTPEIVMPVGSGRVLALDKDKKVLPGWPLGTGAGQQGSAALLDVDGDGNLEVVIGDADSTLYAFEPGTAAPVAGATWPVWGGDPGRTFAYTLAPATGSIPGTSLIVDGSLKCYPNPAKRSPMTVAFQLTEPGQATLTIYDPSGRQIDQVSQSVLRSDNALIWDPSKAAPGMYLGRLDIEASGKKETRLVQLGILH